MTLRRRMTAGNDRQAFTLIEIVLVLGLLVILASLSWPSMGRPLANQALRSAADEIRTSWARARIAAMTSGSTYVFRAYTVPEEDRNRDRKGDRYEIECQVAPEASADVSPVGFGVAEASAVEETGPPVRENCRLPERVRFVGGQTAVDSRAQAASPDISPGLNEGVPLGDPIFFYPDGTTSTSCLRLRNEYGRWMELSLRGLTGVVTVGPVQDPQP